MGIASLEDAKRSSLAWPNSNVNFIFRLSHNRGRLLTENLGLEHVLSPWEICFVVESMFLRLWFYFVHLRGCPRGFCKTDTVASLNVLTFFTKNQSSCLERSTLILSCGPRLVRSHPKKGTYIATMRNAVCPIGIIPFVLQVERK